MSLRTSRACRVGFEQSDCNTNQDLIGAIEMLDRCIDLLRQCHDAGVEVNVETMTMAMLRDDDRKHRESRMALLLAIG
jgi:hypothetical protein